MAASEELANLNGTNVSYRYFSGYGIPVLLVHGVGSSINTWSELVIRVISRPEEISAGPSPVCMLSEPRVTSIVTGLAL